MSSRDLNDCVPRLAEAAIKIVEDYNKMFLLEKAILKPICTLRLTSEQLALFKIGRIVEMVNGIPVVKKVFKGKTVTQIDGVTKPSKHNPIPTQPLSRAVDFGVFIGGKYITDTKYYEPLLELARKYNLRSGWDFRDSGLSIVEIKKKTSWFKDPPHCEVRD
jgi:hypothetical protein